MHRKEQTKQTYAVPYIRDIQCIRRSNRCLNFSAFARVALFR